MKKFMWVLISITMLGLSGCGSGSDEAKELLQRLLRLVGIPHEIVVNVCQDNNKNGFCESIEPSVSIVINKGDTVKTLWQKITQTEDGKYLLESYDPTLPILLQFKDKNNVRYDQGEFTLSFNGFKDNQIEKELSIFEAMRDEELFLESELVAIRNLNRKKDQDKFYAILLKALERNLNTLGDKGILDDKAMSQDIHYNKGTLGAEAMSQNIQYMSSQLRDMGIENELPNKINSCDGNDTCVDNLLEPLFNNILIPTENNQLSPNGGVYDLWDYIVPSNSKTITKTSYTIEKDNSVSDTESTQTIYEVIDENRVTEKSNDRYYDTLYTKKSDSIVKSFDIPDDNYQENLLRDADIGKVIWTFDYASDIYSVNGYCRLSDYFGQKTLYTDYNYSNLIEFTCIQDTLFEGEKEKNSIKKYYQKDNGFVGSIDRDCLNNNLIDDTSIGCEEEVTYYTVVEATPIPTATPAPIFEEIAISHYNGVDFSKKGINENYEEQDGYATFESPTGEYVAGEQPDSGLLWYNNNIEDVTHEHIYLQSFGNIDLATITEVDENAWLPANAQLKSLQIGDVYVVKTHDGYAKFKVISIDINKDGGTFIATYQYSTTTTF